MYKTKNDINLKGTKFSKDHSYIVPTNQAQYRLIKGIFETQTEFRDSLFYDVSAWTLPLAFNLQYGSVTTKTLSLGEQISMDDLSKNSFTVQKSDYAYLFEWNEYYAPKALYHLQKNGLRTKVSNNTFTVKTSDGSKDFGLGTILIPARNQSVSEAELLRLIQEASTSSGVQIHSVLSGFTSDGIDLGSPSFSSLKQPKVLMLVGDGVTSYDAGEVWHLLDQRYQMPTTMVDIHDFSAADLDDYTILVMVNGSYSRLGKKSRSNQSMGKRWRDYCCHEKCDQLD